MSDTLKTNRKERKFSPHLYLNVRGFTLIELMIVIMVISLLVSLFLVGLGHYRNNARDAGIKTLLLEIRNVAEIFYDDIHTYVGVCNADGTLSDSGSFGLIETSINSNGGIVTCQNAISEFAVISALNNGNCWCIDSVSDSIEIGLIPGESCAMKLIGVSSCP
jgi:prepilin-type N-terminal cleavage/methylation domain-containing protein